MSNIFSLGFVALVGLIIGGGCAIYIIGWVIVVWTFNVNPLWGVIVGLIWIVLGYLGQIANKSRKS